MNSRLQIAQMQMAEVGNRAEWMASTARKIANIHTTPAEAVKWSRNLERAHKAMRNDITSAIKNFIEASKPETV